MEDRSPFGRFGPPPAGVESAKIIGMPEIITASVSIVIKCPNGCDTVLLMQGEVGTMVTCLKCKRNWVIGPVQMMQPGQARVAIGEATLKPGHGAKE